MIMPLRYTVFGQEILSNFCPINHTGSGQAMIGRVRQVIDLYEALTAVQVALLTIYDMCKAVDRGMTITDCKLLEKHGGKSGSFVAVE
jgi:hypothetical protein